MIFCKVGQQVYSTGDSGFCDPGWETVTAIEERFDEFTGKPYDLIVCDNMEYRSDTGNCVKGASAYYLTGATRDKGCLD